MDHRVTFVCTGNICRSPLAESLGRQMYGHLGLVFDSCGLAAPVDIPASAGSAAFAEECGAPLMGHRSRPVSRELLTGSAWVIGMTRSHAAQFRSRFGGAYAGRIGILGAPGVDLTEIVHSPEAEEVADPYRQPQDVYDRTGEQIRRLLEGWAPHFADLAGTNGAGP